jgi:hypothetical protein
MTAKKSIATLPIWWLEIERIDGLIEWVIVCDHHGRHLASFFGPGCHEKNSDYRTATNAECLNYARRFVWACGAKPRVKRKKTERSKGAKRR